LSAAVAVSNQWVLRTVSDGDRDQTFPLGSPPPISELIQAGNQRELLAPLVYDWQCIAFELAQLVGVPPPVLGNVAQGVVVEDPRLASVLWEIAAHGSQVMLYRALPGDGPIHAQAQVLATSRANVTHKPYSAWLAGASMLRV
jgi:hypothetical protein